MGQAIWVTTDELESLRRKHDAGRVALLRVLKSQPAREGYVPVIVDDATAARVEAYRAAMDEKPCEHVGVDARNAGDTDGDPGVILSSYLGYYWNAGKVHAEVPWKKILVAGALVVLFVLFVIAVLQAF